MELSCFFDDPSDVGNLISGSSAFSKTNLNIWKFMVHILLMPGLENFEHYFTSMWDVCNCAVVWAFFGIAFLWDWNENWPFPVLWPLLSFPPLQVSIHQHVLNCKDVLVLSTQRKRFRKHPSEGSTMTSRYLWSRQRVELTSQKAKWHESSGFGKHYASDTVDEMSKEKNSLL